MFLEYFCTTEHRVTFPYIRLYLKPAGRVYPPRKKTIKSIHDLVDGDG